MDLFKFVGIFAVGLAIYSGDARAGATMHHVKAPHVELTLRLDHDVVVPNGTINADLHFKIDNGWHLYWRNSGDSGEPPKAEWALPPGWSHGTFKWPIPERIPVGPLVNFGYENELHLVTPIIVGDDSATTDRQELTLGVSVSWLVCQEACIPGKAVLSKKILLGEKMIQSEDVPYFKRASLGLPKAWDGDPIRYYHLSEEKFLKMVIPSVAKEAMFFPIRADVVEHAPLQQLEISSEEVNLRIPASSLLKQAPQQLDGVLVLDGQGYEITAIRSFYDKAVTVPEAQGLDWLAILQAAAFAFLGGIILNFMPCVFPVLSIKIFAALQNRNQRPIERLRHVLAYFLGVYFTFIGLYAVMQLLKFSGSAIGWGFQLQSAVFVSFLAFLFFLFAMNLLGVFEVGTKITGVGSRFANQKGFAGDFFTGLLAVVAATPCTAPFMGSALGFAATQPVFIGLIIFSFLAFGLIAPYALFVGVPKFASVLPKPGPWMLILKEALAFPLFATTAWLVWVVGVQRGVDAGFKLSLGMVLWGFALWGYGRAKSTKVKTVFVLISALAVAASLTTVKNSSTLSLKDSSQEGGASLWISYEKIKLEQLIAEKRPVFIHFTAAWCVSCKVNEMVALTPNVLNELDSMGITLMKGDWTNEDAEVTEALRQFGRDGVPLYVLYSGNSSDAPMILPQVLTKSIVLNAAKKMITNGNKDQKRKY